MDKTRIQNARNSVYSAETSLQNARNELDKALEEPIYKYTTTKQFKQVFLHITFQPPIPY